MKMKKCLIIIISMLLFVGCTNTKNSDDQDILAKQYQIYADKLDNQQSYQTDCKEFTIKLIVNSIDDKSSRYDIIIDSPQINMYHLQAIAKVEKDENKSLPTLGILEENTFSLVPGVIDKENGIYKGINLSGITNKKNFSVLVYLTFYQDSKNKKKEERFIKLYGNASG